MNGKPMSPRAPRDPHPFTTDAYPGEVTTEDLAAIGEALLGAMAGMFAMGHASTAGLADLRRRSRRHSLKLVPTRGVDTTADTCVQSET